MDMRLSILGDLNPHHSFFACMHCAAYIDFLGQHQATQETECCTLRLGRSSNIRKLNAQYTPLLLQHCMLGHVTQPESTSSIALRQILEIHQHWPYHIAAVTIVYPTCFTKNKFTPNMLACSVD